MSNFRSGFSAIQSLAYQNCFDKNKENLDELKMKSEEYTKLNNENLQKIDQFTDMIQNNLSQINIKTADY